MRLNDEIAKLTRVGKTTASRLKRLGLFTVGDLLYHFPFRYDDFGDVKNVDDLLPDQLASVKGKVEMIENRRSKRKRMILTEAIVADDTGKVKVIWFNQSFLTKNIHVGDVILLSGKVEGDYAGMQFTSPSYELIRGDQIKSSNRLVPVYPSTSNVTQKQIRFLLNQALGEVYQLEEWMPEDILKEHDLMHRVEAIRAIHAPQDYDEMEKARYRLQFEEVFLLQMQIERFKQSRLNQHGIRMNVDLEALESFKNQLPFELTGDQEKVLADIINDLQSGRPMNRLLEGDVGSGKTIVAAAAMHQAVRAGYQVTLMAPTEVLAWQHYHNLCSVIPDCTLSLLTSSYRMISGVSDAPEQKKISKKVMHGYISDAGVDIVIGTHALIQNDVTFQNLGLCIIDEQHRFGVAQRKALKSKASSSKLEAREPHLLSMTATPIPRTLALTLYGDLDISVIKEMPKGRKPIFTRVVMPQYRDKAHKFIAQEVKKGRQVYVICPLIDESDKLGVKAVTVEHEILEKKIFPQFNVGLLHGKMKSLEKEQVMNDFKDGNIDILVSTTVIEVGIDVKNATIMMIEGAERFGLAQLHQIRGRVGRGEEQSYCFLFPSSSDMTNINRLKALTESQDGFELAQIDLDSRGPGEVYGVAQSGLPEVKIADLKDVTLIETAKKAAARLLVDDPQLSKYPKIRKQIDLSSKVFHME